MQANNQRLFDFATLESELDPECTVELARSFLDDTPNICDALNQAIAAKDQSTVRSNAHKLKGCCRSINALPVEQESSALEDAASAGDWELIKTKNSSVQELYKALCGEINAYLKGK